MLSLHAKNDDAVDERRRMRDETYDVIRVDSDGASRRGPYPPDVDVMSERERECVCVCVAQKRTFFGSSDFRLIAIDQIEFRVWIRYSNAHVTVKLTAVLTSKKSVIVPENRKTHELGRSKKPYGGSEFDVLCKQDGQF